MYEDLLEMLPEEFNADVFNLWKEDWFLLAAGDFQRGEYNAMTVSWGMYGTLWNDPVVTVVVRPARYTLEFMERFDTFTLCSFGGEYRKALSQLGAVSGRDVPDKIRKAGLTPVAAEYAEAPAFAEAELVLECRKVYQGRISPRKFCDKTYINEIYPERDFHHTFIGRVERIAGIEKYLNPKEA